jgi:hypothetical protein
MVIVAPDGTLRTTCSVGGTFTTESADGPGSRLVKNAYRIANSTGAATTNTPATMFTIVNRSSATPGKSEFVAVVAARNVPTTTSPVEMFVAQLSPAVHAPDPITGCRHHALSTR